MLTKEVRPKLSPEQQEQLDKLNERQKRQLVAMAEERGAEWVVRRFYDLHLLLVQYVR